MVIRPEKIKKILVVRNDRFGEFLLNIPALRALKETFPQARITLVIDPRVRDLAQMIPFVSELLIWKRHKHFIWEKLAFLWQLRRRRFDAAIILNPTKIMHIFAALAGIPIRVGYHRKWDFLLTHSMADTKALGKKHEVQANLELVGLLGAKTADTSLGLKVCKNLPGRDLIAVHPFTSDAVKQWPVERFKELIARLAKLNKGKVVVIGKKEYGDCFDDFSAEGVIDLVGKTNLTQLAYFLSECKLLISCDSGPVHLARCVGTPVVALFRNDMVGKTPERWGPWGRGNIVIQAGSLEAISVDEVERAAMNIVNASSAADAHLSCDIIIPVYNQLDYTKQCLDSIIANTAYPHRIIVVDDASGQETKSYLKGLASQGQIVLLENPSNMGWVASVNNGIKSSTAAFVCVMNNDVEVYPGWLFEMINAAQASEKIGIVNPVWEIPKRFSGTKGDFYKRIVSKNCGDYSETDWARGFCFLIKRQVIDAIGGLDELFSPGYYDDWDFSLRAVKAGFIIVRAKGAFVWHYKNISYKKKLGERNFNRILEEKEKLFRSRWGNPNRILALFDVTDDYAKKAFRELLLNLLRNQDRLSIISVRQRLELNHTNYRSRSCSRLLLFSFVLTDILNNLRLGKAKRYNYIIASANIARFLKGLGFVTGNYALFTFEEALARRSEFIPAGFRSQAKKTS
jgi:ADP-heptose:LPS heptosyltransferase/GT2 family glycosyltransferase